MWERHYLLRLESIIESAGADPDLFWLYWSKALEIKEKVKDVIFYYYVRKEQWEEYCVRFVMNEVEQEENIVN